MTQKRIVDAKQRRAEIMVATLFLVTAAASIAAGFLLEPILTAPNYLAGISPNTAAVAWGALLWSINNIGIVFIAVFMLSLIHISEPTRRTPISYAVFCLKKKKQNK